MASELFTKLPCCCLVEDCVWQEVLVACHIKDEQWLCLDYAWCWREYICLADARRIDGLRILGNPAEARPAVGDIEEARCLWLRTDKRGEPLPPFRAGGGRPVWTPGNTCRAVGRAGSRDDGTLRGPGGGKVSKRTLMQIIVLAQKQVEGILQPAPYLLEALALWQTLVHEMLEPARAACQKEQEEEGPAVLSVATRMRQLKQRKAATYAAAAARSSRSSRPSWSGCPLQGGFDLGRPFRAGDGTYSRGPGRRRPPLDPKYEAACSVGLIGMLDRCWPMLNVQDRIHFLGQAATWAGSMMFSTLNSSPDLSSSSLMRHGFDGVLARALSEASIQLAEGSHEVSFSEPERGCAMVLKALEVQLGLFEGDGSQLGSHILSPSGGCDRFTHFPEVNQMAHLRRWRKVLRTDTSASSNKPEPPKGPRSGLCRLPLVPQRCIASFLITSWPGFAAIARLGCHFRELCFDAGSWAGVQARIPQHRLSDSGPLKLERTGLSNAAVTLLKLAGNGVSVMVDGMDAGQLAKLPVVRVAAKAGLAAFKAKLCLKGLRLYDQLSELGVEDAELEEWAKNQGLQLPRQKRPKLVENDDTLTIPRLPRIPSSRHHELRLVAETNCALVPLVPVLHGVGGARYSLHYVEVSCTGLPSCSSLVQMLGLGLRKPNATSPNSIFQDGMDEEYVRLLLFGRAPEQACRPCLPQRAPGALLVGYEEHIHLAWVPESFCNGDRIGLAAVTHRVGGRGLPSSGSLALVMVHNGKVVGGRWLSEEVGAQDKLVASVELPMLPGATATLLQSGSGAPSLPAFLELLGRPPHMPQAEQPAPRRNSQHRGLKTSTAARFSVPLLQEDLEEEESSIGLSETS